MKGSTLLKRSLSLVFTVVMLFSCWVFTAPKADAATAGKYYVRIWTYHPDRNRGMEHSKKDLTITYKKNNGTGGTGTATLSIGEDFFDPSSGNSGATSSVVECDGFPTSINTSSLSNGNSLYDSHLYIYMQVSSSSNGSFTSVGGGYQNVSRRGGHPSNVTANSGNYPVATSISAISGSDSVAVNTNGSTTNTAAYTLGTVKDQYGVNWYQDASWDTASVSNGVSFSNGTLSVPASSNRADNYTVTLKEKCGNASNTKTVTVNTFDYTVNFLNATGGVAKTQTVNYGASATPPSNPAKSYDSDNHYTFKAWSGSYSSITSGASSRNITPTYNTVPHSYTYSEISGDHANHKATCSCGYSKNVAHTYGSTSFGFATDGKTCTATHTCTGTTGCGHTQTGSLSLNNGITSAQQIAPTCTTMGTTRYTATSPFTGESNVKGTKDVQDIPIVSTAHKFVPNIILENDGNLKTAATCLGNAVYFKVCSYNNAHIGTDTWENPNTALGHHFPDSWSQFDGTDTYHDNTYSGDEYHKHSCDRAGCSVDTAQDINHKWQTDYAPHTWIMDGENIRWTDNGDGTQCYKECSLCHKKVYVTHNYIKTTVDPTCTKQGYDLHTCSSCGYAYQDNYVDAKGHDVEGVAYQSDRSNHWKVCKTCSKNVHLVNNEWVEGTSGHSLNEGEVTTRPTCTETGIKTFTCTVCGNTDNTTTVDALGHNYTVNNVRDATTLKKAATCTENGEYWYTCSRCGDVSDSLFYVVETEGEIGYKLGHTWVRWEGCSEETVSELSWAVPVVFKCQNGCGKYCASTYDEETHEYKSTGNAGDYEYVIGQDTASIPTPSFNEHFEHFDGQMEPPYQYADRKASLRVRPSERGEDTQAMRFSGNISAYNIADKVSFEVNPDKIYDNSKLMSLAEIREKNKADKTAFEDDTVIDFGFVYTQAKYIRSAKETINYDLLTLDYMGKNNPATNQDCRIYRMSVVENNKGNGTLSNNWKGLTDCYNYPTEKAGEPDQYTFNLVINVNVKNYQATYCARTYIIYKYHGDIICVYDQPELNETPIHSHDSVYNQAIKNEATGKLPETVVDYLDYKIINRTIEGKERYIKQSFIDWDWNYKLTNFKEIEQQNPQKLKNNQYHPSNGWFAQGL